MNSQWPLHLGLILLLFFLLLVAFLFQLQTYVGMYLYVVVAFIANIFRWCKFLMRIHTIRHLVHCWWCFASWAVFIWFGGCSTINFANFIHNLFNLIFYVVFIWPSTAWHFLFLAFGCCSFGSLTLLAIKCTLVLLFVVLSVTKTNIVQTA